MVVKSVNNSEDGQSLLPTTLDLARLEDLSVDGRMEAENKTWAVCRYPEKPIKGPMWCCFTLILLHPQIGRQLADFKNTKALVSFLHQLETERKRPKRVN